MDAHRPVKRTSLRAERPTRARQRTGRSLPVLRLRKIAIMGSRYHTHPRARSVRSSHLFAFALPRLLFGPNSNPRGSAHLASHFGARLRGMNAVSSPFSVSKRRASVTVEAIVVEQGRSALASRLSAGAGVGAMETIAE